VFGFGSFNCNCILFYQSSDFLWGEKIGTYIQNSRLRSFLHLTELWAHFFIQQACS
jgi:hypothetical protein